MNSYHIAIHISPIKNLNCNSEWVDAESYIDAMNKLREVYPYAVFTLLAIEKLSPLDWTTQ